MKALSRRATLLAVSALALAACGTADGDDATQTSDSPDAAAVTEMYMGADDAPVTMVEYASWTCVHCLHFQGEVVGPLKDEYVDTGKVKFVFREFPTAPANISVAGFAVARCAGEDKYFDVLDDLFASQTAILSLAREGGQVKAALMEIAGRHGINDEATFDACLQNSDIRKAIAASVAAGEADGITGTPGVTLNGRVLPGSNWRLWDGMVAELTPLLGETAPATEAEVIPAEDSSPESVDTDIADGSSSDGSQE